MATITYTRFAATIKKYIELVSYQQRMSLWLHGHLPHYDYLMGDVSKYHLIGDREISSHNVPFVQKVLVPADSTIILVGDMHGDIQALSVLFEQFKKNGYLDPEERFLRSDCYLVFLGDYGNRKPHSIELIEKLCSLALDNPGQLFLVRGNHEYAISNRLFRQRQRERHEDVQGVTTFLDELETAFPGYQYPDLLYWYDYLPSLLYIGSSDKTGKKQFLSCCHGGLELGWSSKDFLAHEQVNFALPHIIDRAGTLATLEKKFGQDFMQEYQQMLDLLSSQEENSRFLELYKDPTPISLTQEQHSPFDYRLGWLWNNVIAEGNRQDYIAASTGRRTLFLGEKVVQYLLESYGSSSVQVSSVIRGHQHFNEEQPASGLVNPYLDMIRAGQGMIRQWGGIYYTLGGTTTVSHCYSFMTVKTEASGHWGAHHWYKNITDKSWIKKTYFLRDA